MATALLNACATAETFSDEDWDAEFDWCLEHRRGDYVDCTEHTERMDEWITERSYDKTCTLRTGRAFIADHFDWDNMIGELRRCLHEVSLDS